MAAVVIGGCALDPRFGRTTSTGKGSWTQVLDTRQLTKIQIRESYLQILQAAVADNGRTLNLRLIVKFDTQKDLDFGVFIVPSELRVVRIDLTFIPHKGNTIGKTFNVAALELDAAFARQLNLEVKL